MTALINRDQLQLGEGDALIMPPGEIHAFNQDYNDTSYVVLFTESFFIQNISAVGQVELYDIFNHDVGVQKYQCPNEITTLIAALLAERDATIAGPNQSSIFGALLSVFLLKINRLRGNLAKQRPNDFDLDLFTRFRRLLKIGYKSGREVKSYAQKLNISAKQLNHLCQSVTGKNVKTVIDNYVLMQIKRNLLTTVLTSKEIGYLVGFDDPANFVKYFKRLTNQTPSQFRKGHI